MAIMMRKIEQLKLHDKVCAILGTIKSFVTVVQDSYRETNLLKREKWRR